MSAPIDEKVIDASGKALVRIVESGIVAIDVMVVLLFFIATIVFHIWGEKRVKDFSGHLSQLNVIGRIRDRDLISWACFILFALSVPFTFVVIYYFR